MSDAYHCPKCGSENTQKFSLIHAGGTSGSVGLGVGTTGHGDVGAGVMASRNQSTLAKRCAPPTKMEISGAVAFFLVAGGVLWLMWSGWAFVVAAVLSALMIAGAVNYNKTEFPKKFAAWNSRFLCMRCGHEFSVEPAASAR